MLISVLLFLESRGYQWQTCGLFSVLNDLYKHLTAPGIRVPFHVLLTGEDLLKREVLNQPSEATTGNLTEMFLDRWRKIAALPLFFAGRTVECIWRSSHFRAAIGQKLAEAFENHPELNAKNIEEQIFAKAKSKDEYLELAARVIIHCKHHDDDENQVCKTHPAATKRKLISQEDAALVNKKAKQAKLA